jgi:hypothetical protein
MAGKPLRLNGCERYNISARRYVMGTYKELYDFAAKAGALEGYVYPKDKVDLNYVPLWVDHLLVRYQALPAEVREEFQKSCNGTIGRAIQALLPHFGEDHEIIRKLRNLTAGEVPSSPDDFPDRGR